MFIADDQVLLRRGLASLIRAEPDMEFCGEAGDYRTAADAVRELRPNVLITEICLGGEIGTGFIARIKSIEPTICIVVLTHQSEAAHAVPAIKAGASALVTKQSPPARVVEVIRNAMNGRMSVSESVSTRMLARMFERRDNEDFSPSTSLSCRELEVFTMIGAGKSTRDIAEKLGISLKTVEAHRAHIKEKAGMGSGFELLQSAMRWSGDVSVPV